MIDDILKSIKASLYDRTSSPLFGTFLVSWCAWNFKLFIIIFSDTEVSQKLSLIDAFFREDYHGILGVAIPLIITLVWVLIYPHPARWVYEYARIQQLRLKEIRKKTEGEAPLTREEEKAIRREMYELQEKYENDFKTKNEEIKKQKEGIEHLSEELTRLKNEKGTIASELDEVKKRFNKEHYNRVSITLPSDNETSNNKFAYDTETDPTQDEKINIIDKMRDNPGIGRNLFPLEEIKTVYLDEEDIKILRHIKDGRYYNAGDIANKLSLSKITVSYRSKKIADYGLIDIIESKSVILITQKGLDYLNKLESKKT